VTRRESEIRTDLAVKVPSADKRRPSIADLPDEVVEARRPESPAPRLTSALVSLRLSSR
jgi:hypothetical protein